uniref:Uncharacterized protein n=1 Tax=Romanomermis culicivorax TaxID=13658 RepID=A0A915HF85_ROMCU
MKDQVLEEREISRFQFRRFGQRVHVQSFAVGFPSENLTAFRVAHFARKTAKIIALESDVLWTFFG